MKEIIKVGDIVIAKDGSGYIGKVIHISRKEDTVKHKCIVKDNVDIKFFPPIRVGQVFTKSYTGFGVRYSKAIFCDGCKKYFDVKDMHDDLCYICLSNCMD